eukprot:6392761-Pyramimonas_sp.AAC.1
MPEGRPVPLEVAPVLPKLVNVSSSSATRAKWPLWLVPTKPQPHWSFSYHSTSKSSKSPPSSK